VEETDGQSEDPFSKLLDEFVLNTPEKVSRTQTSADTSSASTLSLNSRGRSPPPKPPRKGKSSRHRKKRFSQKDHDVYAAAWLAARRGGASNDDSTSALDSCVTSSDEREKVYYRLAWPSTSPSNAHPPLTLTVIGLHEPASHTLTFRWRWWWYTLLLLR